MTLSASDVLEIQSLIADYPLSIDARDFERFSTLWWEDAVVDVNRDAPGLGAPLRGRDEILRAFKGWFDRNTYRAGSFMRHLCTTSRIEQVGDDEVRAQTPMLSVKQDLVDGRIEIAVSKTGLYTDRIVRSAGRWLFAERLIAWDPPEREDVVLPAELYGARPQAVA